MVSESTYRSEWLMILKINATHYVKLTLYKNSKKWKTFDTLQKCNFFLFLFYVYKEIKLLRYRYRDIGGSININGQLRNMREFKKISCYIMQNDLIQPNLTVFEAMSFAADLKLGRRKSKSQKCAIVSKHLSLLL